MNSLLVSVVIPVYNSIDFLNETLESVRNQTYKNIEVLVADNGSTDLSTLEYLKALEKEVNVIYTGKTGVSNARNKAIEEATGVFVLPLDSDDIILPSFVEECIKVFESDQTISVVRTQIELFGKRKGKIEFATYNYATLLARNLMVVTSMFKKSDWQRVGGYDIKFLRGFEDWEFWLNLLKSGGKVHTIPEPLFKYRIRRGSRNQSLKQKDLMEIRKMLWEKHREQYSKHFVDPKESFEYKLIADSKYLKFGKLLLSPFSFLKLMD